MKILKTTMLLLITSISMFSCTPDDGEQSRMPEKEFTHAGITYNIKNAVISEESPTEHLLVFYTEGMSLNAAKDDLIGSGDVVYFTINSSDIIGDYYFGSSEEDYENGACVINFDIAAETFASNDSIENGSITIETYFDGGYHVSINDPVVNLIYEGELEEVNF